MSNSKKRAYVSELRDQSAKDTRERILATAKALFARKGIDKVTIAQIAEKAGVAAPTVYASFKSKEGILRAIMREALFGERTTVAQRLLEGVSDPAKIMALTAQVCRAIYESESEELGLLRGASSFSPALRKVEQEFEQMRFAMQEERVKRLFAQSKAKAGLTLEEARRVLWMYTSRDVYRMLVQEGGWSADRYQEWLSGTLLATLVK